MKTSYVRAPSIYLLFHYFCRIISTDDFEMKNTSHMRIRSCIFDLDGVIIDTPRLHFQAWRRVANELDFDISSEQNEQLKGLNRQNCLKTILDWGKIEQSSSEFNRWMERKNTWYLQLLEENVDSIALPGAIPFINHLGKIGIHVSLGSASFNARYILEKLGIKNLFNKIVDGKDVAQGKPSPETFLSAISDTDIKPNEAIVFEDSINGITAAINGGFYAVGIGKKDILKKADIVIPGLSNLNFSLLISNLFNSIDKQAVCL